MENRDVELGNAVKAALANLFAAIKKAERAGLQTHIYVPEGDGGEAAGGAYVEVSRVYKA